MSTMPPISPSPSAPSVPVRATSAVTSAVTSADWAEVFALLDVALELDAPAQAAWLAALPAAQARLEALLRELLRTHADQSSAGFLQRPVPPEVGMPGAMAAPPYASPTRAGLPAQIGPYRLLREIGQGGMASVWLAERADGLLDRHVALKLPHTGWGTARLAEQMARERNILAALVHPNIARLYDAGLDSDGRPYLALEYIDGQPINSHAATRRLPLRARLELLLQVAHAVAHAHDRRVVHRDLKPSNILVDAQGQAHLLDFGIARLLEPLAAASHGAYADATLTLAHGRALTPDYASPEQIRGDAVGMASDVYSLGVVAYELLAGVRPYRLPGGLGAVALAAALAALPVPLASRATRGMTQGGSNEKLGASPTAWPTASGHELAGDIDAILTRALAHDIANRYPSVGAFAQDLQRHLRGEPVSARRPSLAYRGQRWLARHRLEAAVAAALLLALLLALVGGAHAQLMVLLALGGGTAVALWQRRQAVQQSQRARRAQLRAEQVKDFIASIFTQAVPRAGQGGAVTAADLLRAAARRIDTDLQAQPDVAAELSALIGASFNELGETRAGLEELPKAVQRCTQQFGSQHLLTLQARWRLIEAANTQGELSVAEPFLVPLVTDLRQALAAQREQAVGAGAGATQLPDLLVEALRSHAFVLTKRGHADEALAALREALALAEASHGPDGDTTLSSRDALSNTLLHFDRGDDALAAIEPALEPARRLYGPLRPHPVLLMVERSQASALGRANRPRDAAAGMRQVLADQRLLDTEDTPRVRVALSLLVNALLSGGQLAQAEALAAEAAALHRRLTGGANHEGLQLTAARATISLLQGNAEAALNYLDAAAALTAVLGDAEAPVAQRTSLRVLALATAGHSAGALQLAESLLHPPTPPTPTPHPAAWRPATLVRLHRARAWALRQSGDLAAAQRAAAEAVFVANSPATGKRCGGLEHGLALAESARCKLALGDTEHAVLDLREALAVWARTQVDGAEIVGSVQAELQALGG